MWVVIFCLILKFHTSRGNVGRNGGHDDRRDQYLDDADRLLSSSGGNSTSASVIHNATTDQGHSRRGGIEGEHVAGLRLAAIITMVIFGVAGCIGLGIFVYCSCALGDYHLTSQTRKLEASCGGEKGDPRSRAVGADLGGVTFNDMVRRASQSNPPRPEVASGQGAGTRELSGSYPVSSPDSEPHADPHLEPDFRKLSATRSVSLP